jgi:hypothetical protein
LRLTENASVPAGLMMMYVLAAAVLLGGVWQISLRATSWYLVIVGVAVVSVLLNVPHMPPSFISKMSLLFLVVLYAPLCVSLRQGAVAPELWRWTVSVFIGFAVFLGLAGVVQYFAQFVFSAEWLFDFTPLIPERLRGTAGFNTEYGIQSSTGELAWVKSNGFFMREPSLFSMVIAFGLLCELMAVLGAGLIVSHAASGLLCLAAGLVFPLGRSNFARAAAFALLAAGVVFFLRDTQNVQVYLNRTHELATTNTSAYCRFVAPTVDVLRQIDSHPWTSLVGHGPGSMARMAEGCAQQPNTYAKALFEYGLVGTLAFGALMIGALNRSSAPLRIRVAAGVGWVLLGGLLDALCLLFIYVVSAMWPEGTARRQRDTAHSVSPRRRSRYGYAGHAR